MSRSADSDEARREVGLPPLVFTFTLDQIAAMLSVAETDLKKHYLYYAHRSVGVQSPDQMYAVNVAPATEPAQWRVSQKEFARFVRRKGFRLYDITKLWG